MSNLTKSDRCSPRLEGEELRLVLAEKYQNEISVKTPEIAFTLPKHSPMRLDVASIVIIASQTCLNLAENLPL